MGKRLVMACLLIALAVTSLAGCGQKSAPPKAGEPAVPGAPAAPAATYTLRFGHDQMQETPHHEAAVKFKELVESRSGGKVKVELYPAMQLGKGREMIEGMQVGSVQGVALPTSNFSGFDMATSIPDVPFIFTSPAYARATIDGELGNAILKRLSSQGMVGAAWWESGFKCFTGNFPIRGPKDYKGKKIRVMGNPLLIAQYEAWGAGAIPIDFGELYNALQQKVVDGQENPLSTIVNMKFHEVQKYVTLSNHGWLPYIVAFSKKWLDTLPADLQQVVVTAAKEVSAFESAEIRRLEAEKYLPAVKKQGCEVIELTPEAVKEFRDSVVPVYKKFRDEILKDDEARALFDKFVEASKK